MSCIDYLILVIDIGNTHVVCGLYKHHALIHLERCDTAVLQKRAACITFLQAFFDAVQLDPCSLDGIAIASVVPKATASLCRACLNFCRREPLIIGPELELGIRIAYTTPHTLGTDRIVNAVAAFEKYKRGLIVIDSGTATTFDVVTDDGCYQGGAIAPGITMMRDALSHRTAQLPFITLEWNGRAIGSSTIECLQSGIVAGYVSLVDGMVERMRLEAGKNLYAVATGGLSDLLARYSKTIDVVEPHLTLEGIRLIYGKNKKNNFRHNHYNAHLKHRDRNPSPPCIYKDMPLAKKNILRRRGT
ncbi:MAG: type III pantothenate kinase [Desulfobacterota bacterium]|nr:type III pantothenate kinase [Thermodesulfobacteriota bacterium]